MSKATCSVDDCVLVVFERGWCVKHYNRWYRWGDVHHVTAPTERRVVRNRVAKTCPNCCKTFEVRASKADKYKFCSLECRKQYGKANLMLNSSCETCGMALTWYQSQQTRRWCSVQCQIDGAATTACCVACHGEFTLPQHLMKLRRGCSQSCSQKLRWESRDPWGSFKEKLATGYRTDIEALAEAVLQILGVRYEFEKRIGRFWIDFALPDLMVALECDGWQHAHKAKKDAERDTVLLLKGWRTVRIVDADLRRDARGVILRALPELLGPTEQLGLLG